MGRKPSCDKLNELKRGPWTVEEDQKLTTFILNYGIQCWRHIPKLAGLMRCGKSCRLRWMNYLRPGLKREPISEEEETLLIQLHSTLGNRWSKIAAEFPGRTDNAIKNHWNKIKNKIGGLDDLHGVQPHDQDQTHKLQPAEDDVSKTKRENINGSDHRSSSSPSSSSSSSSCVSSSTHENSSSGVLIDSSQTTLVANADIPKVDHQAHTFSPEMEESFSDEDFHCWLQSAVEPILSWDGIDP